MGETKRAQELRVEEFSVQKLRESHETIQKLTSQIQEMQEQMNSVNDSGEFQKVESKHSGRLSHVSSRPAVTTMRFEIVLRFQSTSRDSKFSFCAEPRQTPAP